MMMNLRTIADAVGVSRKAAEKWVALRQKEGHPLPAPVQVITYTLDEHGFDRTYRFWSEEDGNEIIARYRAERQLRS